MRIRDWSSDVCSSDLLVPSSGVAQGERMVTPNQFQGTLLLGTTRVPESSDPCNPSGSGWIMAIDPFTGRGPGSVFFDLNDDTKFDTSDKITVDGVAYAAAGVGFRSEEHTSELQSLMRISYAVFCLKKKKK